MAMDPRIHTIGLRIRFLLLSSVTFKMPSKRIFFLPIFWFLFTTCTVHLCQSSKNNKSQNCINQRFSSFYCLLMEGSGFGAGFVQIIKDAEGQKTILRIRNTGNNKQFEKAENGTISVIKDDFIYFLQECVIMSHGIRI